MTTPNSHEILIETARARRFCWRKMRKNGASPDARGRRAAVRAFGPQIRRARAQLVSTYNYRARAILVVVITGSRTLRGHDRGTTTTARRIPSFENSEDRQVPPTYLLVLRHVTTF